jgi:hypothetical protein
MIETIIDGRLVATGLIRSRVDPGASLAAWVVIQAVHDLASSAGKQYFNTKEKGRHRGAKDFARAIG